MRQKKSPGVVYKQYKNRTYDLIKRFPKLKLGDCGFFYFKEFRFELVYLKLLRKRIKRVVRLAKRILYFVRRD